MTHKSSRVFFLFTAVFVIQHSIAERFRNFQITNTLKHLYLELIDNVLKKSV